MNKTVKNFNHYIRRVENSSDEMGLKIDGDEIELLIPESLRIESKNDIFLFLNSLRLSDSAKDDNVNKSNDKNEGIPFYSYLWIIKDYVNNGYFHNRDKKDTVNSGKINWKKTLRRQPIYSSGNFIYDKLDTTRVSMTNDEIAEIYRFCLKTSIEIIGWLFGFNQIVEIRKRMSKVEMLSIMKKALKATFNDEKKIRFTHMLKIIEASSQNDSDSTHFSYTIKNYYYVYETMIDEFFDGIKDHKDYNPKGFWAINNEDEIEASTLRPDTVFELNGNIYVLDAKMYKYGFTGNRKDLPESQSIQKQITYGDYIHNKQNKPVRNGFIIPFDKTKNFKDEHKYTPVDRDGNFRYIGYSYGDWRTTGSPTDHDKIYTFLIDFNYLLNNYRHTNKDDTKQLCEFIDNVLLKNQNVIE